MENEVRILEIDVKKWTSMLEKLGAQKVGDWKQIRKVYDFKPVQKNKWIRLRTNGEESTLTIKEVLDSSKVDGTRELEIQVSDFEKASEILEELGYIPRNIQENKRIRYLYHNVEIDIDSWPLIPTYVEIEAPSVEEVNEFLNLISYDQAKLTTLGVADIYETFYQMDANSYSVLTFEEQIK